MSEFLLDPTPLYAEMRLAWEAFTDRTSSLVAHSYSLVTSWREAKDNIFLPIHPMSDTLNTSLADEWHERPVRFVDRVSDENRRMRHGFDAAGSVVIVELNSHCVLAMRNDNVLDVASAHPNDDREFSPSPVRPHYKRHYLDGFSRIIKALDFSPTEDEHLNVETFTWKGDRLAESVRQSFQLDGEIPLWARDKTPDELSNMHRKANATHREFMPRRQTVSYRYNKKGNLIRAEQFSYYHKRTTVIYKRGRLLGLF